MWAPSMATRFALYVAIFVSPWLEAPRKARPNAFPDVIASSGPGSPDSDAAKRLVVLEIGPDSGPAGLKVKSIVPPLV